MSGGHPGRSGARQHGPTVTTGTLTLDKHSSNQPFTDSRLISKIGIITQNVGFRYYLYNLAFQHWRTFVSMQREKKSKVQFAVQFGKCLRQVIILDFDTR